MTVPPRPPPGAVAVRRWVYLLLEHQSRPDPFMPLRLLTAMVELWQTQLREWEDARTPAAQRRLRPVVPLVFYTGKRRWLEPLRLADRMEAPAELARFIPSWATLFLNLHHTSPETLAGVATAAGYALQVLQAEMAPVAELETVLAEALAGLEGLTEEQAGQWLRVTWFLLLLVFHRRDRGEYTELGRLIQERARASKFRLEAEVERMGKSMAQVVEERGEARGEIRGLRHALATVLESRFGPLPAAVEEALAAADLDTLDIWLRRATRVESLDQVDILPPAPRP